MSEIDALTGDDDSLGLEKGGWEAGRRAAQPLGPLRKAPLAARTDDEAAWQLELVVIGT